MSKAGFFRSLSLKHFSQPTSDRVLYRRLKKDNAHRILEIGMGDGTRAENIISLALRFQPAEEVKFTGIDLFEAREDTATATSLKEVHRRLKATGAKVRLVPGDARSALPRCANDLRGTDWVIISADQEDESVAAAMNYLPRILHQTSKVWMEKPNEGFEILTVQDITAKLVDQNARRKAA